ncbi:MAG: enoyl-CoA hydratase/isomerase family protein [Terriglobales bacterium]
MGGKESGGPAMTFNKIRCDSLFDGRVAKISLAAPKANIVDQTMIVELERAFSGCKGRRLHAIVLTAEGPNFSYGASVQEHLPEHIQTTLQVLHRLLRTIAGAEAPVIAAVRGQCLGGGFELVLACDLIIAEADAVFASPEIKLGVFPPAACALLPVRIGAASASAVVLTGASLCAEHARSFGLVSQLVASGELERELLRWLESDFAPRSRDSLRLAAQATRRPVLRALEQDLPVLERLYLDELMKCDDAVEGIRAFLEKRAPRFAAVAR